MRLEKFRRSPTKCKHIHAKRERTERVDYQKRERTERETIQRDNTQSTQKKTLSVLLSGFLFFSISDGKKYTSILDFDPAEAARQFTLIASELYRLVPPSELVGGERRTDRAKRDTDRLEESGEHIEK